MPNLDPLKDILKRSTELWDQKQHSEALKFLDGWIAQARQENQTTYVQLLSMHASAIAQSMGNLDLVRRYSEQMLSSEPDDALANALALYTLADAMLRQGKTDLAKQHAAKSYALVAHSKGEEERALLEILIGKWPEVADWRS